VQGEPDHTILRHMHVDGTIRYPTVQVDLLGASESVEEEEKSPPRRTSSAKNEPLIKKLDPHSICNWQAG
jgi:hypothetical protein